ncbi:MAG: hypothetical protein F4X57_11145 [Chloroflexi bacterium]|nr:hypothetical protein [Chloroflexota bacterium]
MKPWIMICLAVSIVLAANSSPTPVSAQDEQSDPCRTTFLLRFDVEKDQVIFPNHPAHLFWAVHNAAKVELQAQDRDEWRDEWETVPAVGLREIRHENDTHYKLRMTNAEGASFESTLFVDIHESPHFYTLSVTPYHISAGEYATLAWTTRHTHWVNISSLPGAGRTYQDDWPETTTKYPADGSHTVSPTETTTYRITAVFEHGNEFDGGSRSNWRFITVYVDEAASPFRVPSSS